MLTEDDVGLYLIKEVFTKLYSSRQEEGSSSKQDENNDRTTVAYLEHLL